MNTLATRTFVFNTLATKKYREAQRPASIQTLNAAQNETS
jgi:hypothetical protein